jgi:hypothetical protein
MSHKGLVLHSPPKKRVATPVSPPKGKPPTEKKQAEKLQPEKKQAQSKPPSPSSGKKASVPLGPPTGNGGMDDLLQSVVASLSENTDVVPDQFSSPTDFFPNYKKPEPNAPLGFDIPEKLASGIEDSRLIRSKAPSQVYDELSASLSQSGYVPTPIPNGYGGGLLYKIDKDKFTAYLNLVPTTNGSDTVVVTWSTNPSN